MKRIAALWMLVCLLCLPVCAGAETFATYQLPQGAQVCYVSEAAQLEAPQGLEGMYALMSTAAARTDVYLIRMPHGRALASVSCAPAAQAYTAQELKSLWPQIAENIRREAAYVNDSPSCAAVENRFGAELLHIRTDLTLSGAETLSLCAEGFAFCRGREMLEVWTVYPQEPVYLYSEQAAKELAQDREALEAFLESLSFGNEEQAIESEPYADPDGRFVMHTPKGSVIITAQTPMAEVSAARERFVAANEEGAGNAFDQMMTDVYEQQVLLVFTGDMKGAVQVFCSREPDFAGVTPDMLRRLAEPIRRTLEERFGIALALSADGTAVISQKEHSHLCYWLRSGECDLQLDVLGCVVGEDWLCEVDVFTVDGEQELRSMLHSLVAQTLCYLVE